MTRAACSGFWPTATHFVGKEIVRQHALYWPAFLMSAGLPPPRRIIAHGWWLMGGAKMSKSVGNVARYQDYASIFGVDALRYFVMREMPLGADANFSDDGILTRFNADLANDLGNLVSRATTMMQRYCEGVVPDVPPGWRDALDADLATKHRQHDRVCHPAVRLVPDQRGAPGHLGAGPGREPVHREARAVGAGEETGRPSDARGHAVSRRGRLTRHRRACGSGDA